MASISVDQQLSMSQIQLHIFKYFFCKNKFGNNSAVGGNYGSDYLSISSSSAIDYNIDILFIFNQTGPGVPQGV